MIRERKGGGPEHNIIQAPEMLRRLAKATGMRQAHVVPAMNEGIQPVIIVADVSEQADADLSAAPPRDYIASAWSSPIAGNDGFQQILPLSGGAIRPGTTWRLKYLRLATNNVGPVRARLGWRDTTVGAPVTTTAYPDRLEVPLPQPVAFQINVGSAASGTNQLTVAWGEFLLSAGNDVVLYDTDLPIVLEADRGGFIWQIFNVGAGQADLVLFSLWEEIAP